MAVQTPMNCHCELEKYPVMNVEPVKFIMQYLSLTDPGRDQTSEYHDDTRSGVQHTLLTCLVLTYNFRCAAAS